MYYNNVIYLVGNFILAPKIHSRITIVRKTNFKSTVRYLKYYIFKASYHFLKSVQEKQFATSNFCSVL